MRRFSTWWSKLESIGFGLSLFISILTASVGIRLGTIFKQPIFDHIKIATITICGVLGFIILLKNRWTWAIFSSLFVLSILTHAFVLFYQPSFAPNISFQDYFLGDLGSSNWSLDVAKLYLTVFFQFMFPALAAMVVSPQQRRVLIRLIILAFTIGFLANSALAIYQGLVDLTFWAQGSGTAVTAGRAAAFLEDSGSSSVYFAALTVAVFWSLLFSRSVLCTFYSAIILIIGFSGGVFAGGKIFFVSSLVSIALGVLASIFNTLKTRNKRKSFLLLFMSCLTILTFINIFFIHTVQSSSILLDFVKTSWNQKLSFAEALEYLDASRLFHIEVMWKVFCKHFWTGTGLGSFLANLSNYAPKDMPKDWFDWPSCFYLMLMSELGIVGLVLVVVLIGIWLNQILVLMNYKTVASQLDDSNDWVLLDLLVPAATGAITSLLISLLVGVHLIYPVNSAIAAFALAVAVGTMPMMKNRLAMPSIFTQCWRYILPICAAYLLVISAIHALDPPRVPAFHWLDRSKPQIPVHIRQELEGKKGYWTPGATEILVQEPNTYLYVKHPDELFPVTVNVEFVNTSARKVDSQQFTLQKRQWFAVSLPTQIRKECLAPANPSRFCSLRLTVSPVWRYEHLEMGVFVADSKAELPP